MLKCKQLANCILFIYEMGCTVVSTAFGEFLHNVRKRTKGTQVAKSAGISYVYLLDLEKGARPVPSDTVLMALADSLPFNPGEREHFFDLAAAENGCAPLDVSTFIRNNKPLIDIIRRIERTQISIETLCALAEGAEKKGEFAYDK